MPSPRESATLSLRIQPGAKREGIIGSYGEALKVAIAAPAVDGKANEALLRLLAALLGIPKSRIEILSGHTSRSKIVRIDGLSADEVQTVLNFSDGRRSESTNT